MYQQLVGKLLWIDRADLRCAMGKASSLLGQASARDMKNLKSILRYSRLTIEPLQFGLEKLRREHVQVPFRRSVILAGLVPLADALRSWTRTYHRSRDCDSMQLVPSASSSVRDTSVQNARNTGSTKKVWLQRGGGRWMRRVSLGEGQRTLL